MSRVARCLANPVVETAPWIALLLCVLLGDERRDYVAAWNDPLLIVGLAIAGGGLLGWLLRGAHSPQRPPRFAWAGLAIQCLPLYVLLAVDGETLRLGGDLDHMLSEAAPVGDLEKLTASDLGLDVNSFTYRQGNSSGSGSGNALPAPAPTDGSPRRLDLVAVNSRPERLRGGTVRVIGRLRRSDARLSELGADGLLYRYAITCCVADAQPMSALLVELPSLDLVEDAWVMVSGELRDPASGPPVIVVEELTAVEEPREPYLSLGLFR